MKVEFENSFDFIFVTPPSEHFGLVTPPTELVTDRET
jgi:hypothetical protein